MMKPQAQCNGSKFAYFSASQNCEPSPGMQSRNRLSSHSEGDMPKPCWEKLIGPPLDTTRSQNLASSRSAELIHWTRNTSTHTPTHTHTHALVVPCSPCGLAGTNFSLSYLKEDFDCSRHDQVNRECVKTCCCFFIPDKMANW